MPNYGDPQYWEDRYKESAGKVFEWLEDFSAIESLIFKFLSENPLFPEDSTEWKKDAKILNLGCGNSTIAEDLYDKGLISTVNMDISTEVIKQMSDRNLEKRPELQWHVMDVREMTYDDNTFDLIIDKSTIDAILCGDNAFINTAQMMRECQRVLKTGGIYMGISYGYPESRVLHYKRAHLHMELRVFEIQPQNPKDSLHYVYVCKKLEGADEISKQNYEKVENDIREDERKMIELYYKQQKSKGVGVGPADQQQQE